MPPSATPTTAPSGIDSLAAPATMNPISRASSDSAVALLADQIDHVQRSTRFFRHTRSPSIHRTVEIIARKARESMCSRGHHKQVPL